MDGHASSGGQLLVADMALEMFGLLVLNQYLFVIELALAVITPDLGSLPLLLAHSFSSSCSSSSSRLLLLN
jgi:hypothetical protein